VHSIRWSTGRAQAIQEQFMSELNKRIARQWIDSVNSKDPNKLMDVWTEDFVVHAGAGLPEIRDGETMKRIIGTFWTTVPDLHVSVDDVLAEGDRVAIRVTSRGTHTGHFRSVAPTGRKVEFPGYAVFRMQDGKAAEEWILDDLLTFLRQIGVIPASVGV
jgi:steroid delta-isomerase-like uncharacterized protein